MIVYIRGIKNNNNPVKAGYTDISHSKIFILNVKRSFTKNTINNRDVALRVKKSL